MFLTEEAQTAAAVNLSKRLKASEIRSVLATVDQPRNGSKSVERIVSETEEAGRAISDVDLAQFLIDVSGPDLLDNRELRYLLALHASDPELDELRTFPATSPIRGITVPIIARSISERRWHPGKRWARHFVSVLGFAPVFAGVVGQAGGPDSENVEPHVPLPPLEPFQNDLREQVIQLLSNGPGANRGILTLPTGAGKTRTTVEAVIDWHLSGTTEQYLLWIAQSDELCEQAVGAFKEVWIDRGAAGVRELLKIYRFWGARQTVLDEAEPGIVISTIDKLRSVLNREQTDDKYQALMYMARQLGLIVIDEAHGAEAPSYRKVLASIGIDFSSAAQSQIPILGLTATPLRSQHEETMKLAKRFYSTLLRPRNLPEDPADAVAELRSTGVLSHPTHQILKRAGKALQLTSAQERYLEEWNDLHPELLMQLGQEKDRNRQLVESILALDASWPILFFGCSVQHAEAMAILLRRKGRSAAAITGETRDATRRHLIEEFRSQHLQVLCNYGVLTTGFDAPQMRAVIIGRPTTSRLLYEQMIGRGMRGPRFGGTADCLVIDIDDNLIHRDGSSFTTASQNYAEYWTSTQSLVKAM